MAPFFANQSCDPFLPQSSQCVIGTYVQYAVNVSSASHVSQAIEFAAARNIRLVIRNTGHDYNGKSTGAGALGIWTHHLKDLTLISNYSDAHYTGPAIKMGAGIQGFEAYAFANVSGLRVVGGECPTVGIAGGYTQGGGHSALSSKYGLAADQTLEWDVVTGSGQLLTASRLQNEDLYWALSGGGGGTYGVVVSLTVKAHQDGPVSGANLTFTNAGVSQEAYYSAIETFHASLPAIVDAGAMSVWYFTNSSFSISPLTGPDVSAADMRTLLQPLTDKLAELNINYTSYVADFPSYLAQFMAMQSPIEVGIAQYGGRLIPRSVVTANNSALTAAYRAINDDGGLFIGVGLNVAQQQQTNSLDNAVNPGWRTALIDTVITTPWNFSAPWSEMLALQRRMTDELLPRLEALTPGGSCYLNEGDFRQPDWQTAFYGSNYARLRAVKDKYDPDHAFYAVTAVGSEEWVEQADRRLCRI
ncbi:hypothetical protein MBLNU459_g2661t1 [Dothideomycetes sp. NU459]